jgi:N-methylhydantoinase A/oxoprolinase/acetone carboxylase beta subunit
MSQVVLWRSPGITEKSDGGPIGSAAWVAANSPPTQDAAAGAAAASGSGALPAGAPLAQAAAALPIAPASATRADPIKGTRPVYFPELREFRRTTVYDRYALVAGQAFDGPAIVEERESTLVIGPGGRFQVAPSGNIIVAIG